MSLDDQLLARYMATFYGYGAYRGRWWLVGMEEGGGTEESEIQTRLALWKARGQKELEDVAMFEGSAELGKWFTPRPPLQPTWRKLIRLILSAEGRSTDPEAIREYQGAHLGRTNSDNCLLELLPLPSSSTQRWIYAEHSRLADVRDRRTYLERVAPTRVANIRQRIREYRPRGVIFYSRGYRAHWEQIAGSPFASTVVPGLDIATSGSTVFALTQHPTATGVTNDYFAKAGVLIGDTSR
jgi:hypothetical protein